MELQEILSLYEKELRIELVDPDMQRESLPLVVRHLRADPPMGFITFSRLDETSADAEIRAQMAWFAGRQLPFEWNVFAYDKPSNLEERLVAYGFKPDLEPDDPGPVLVLDLHDAPLPLLSRSGRGISQIARHQLDEVVHIEQRVWGGDFSWLKEKLYRHMGIPGYLSVFVARVGDDPACCGWIYYHPQGHFATLRGGSTVPEHRNLGLYVAVLSARARQALERGVRFLTIDASPMSRPILERYGFQLLTFARSYKWRPVQEAPAAT